MQSLLVYGGSSTGKTSLAGQFARYQASMHGGLPCLYVGADSGWESAMDEVIDGVMLPYNLASHPDPLWALRRIARGMWPENINPLTGVAQHPNRLFMLPQLGIRISGLIIEGVTRIGELIAGNMTNELVIDTQEPLTAKFRLRPGGHVVQGSALLAPQNDDEESFSMASRGTYKFVQEQTYDWISRVKAHPFAPRLLVTAHQGDGMTSGDGVKARCLGPVVFGKAGVDKCPGWFSSYFHVETIPRNFWAPNSPEMRALWFQHHHDPASGLMWPGKLGASATFTHGFRQQHPHGFIPAWIDDKGKLQGGLASFTHAFDTYRQTAPSGTVTGPRLIAAPQSTR